MCCIISTLFLDFYFYLHPYIQRFFYKSWLPYTKADKTNLSFLLSFLLRYVRSLGSSLEMCSNNLERCLTKLEITVSHQPISVQVIDGMTSIMRSVCRVQACKSPLLATFWIEFWALWKEWSELENHLKMIQHRKKQLVSYHTFKKWQMDLNCVSDDIVARVRDEWNSKGGTEDGCEAKMQNLQ